MPKSQAKRLLVEGETDKRVFPYLLEGNGVVWPKGDEPVDIKPLGSKEVRKTDVTAQLVASGLRILGLILDADDDVIATWGKVKGWLSDSFPDLIGDLPREGFISLPNAAGIKLGVWIMPDNQSRGMLETFLMFLAPDDQDPLVKYAATARDQAKKKWKAPFKDVHADKAKIHTWLAWQGEPGPQLHEAVDRRVLDPTSPHSKPFVAWFRKLFEL